MYYMERIYSINLMHLKILIIDDDYHDFLFLKEILEDVKEIEYSISHANSYEAALESSCQAHSDYDLLIMDYDLGLKKGYDLYQEIRIHKDIPCIFLTGNKNNLILEELETLKPLAALHKDRLDTELFINLVKNLKKN